MKIARPNIEVIDDQTAQMLAAKSGAQRLSILFGMHRFALQLLRQRIMTERPCATLEERDREVSRRLLHGSI